MPVKSVFDNQDEGVRYSVIVPAYNAEGTIGECVAALLDQSTARSRYEVLVVDDGSTDGTAQVLERYPVRVLHQVHRGPASARNLGAQAARGDFLLFTDADCCPSRRWIEMLVAPMEADGNIVGVKGSYLTEQTSVVARFCQVEFAEKYDRLARRRYIDFVDTYSAAFRKDAFWAGGAFDPVFPVPSVEDAQLSFNLASMGRRLVFAPLAVVYHRHPESLSRYLFRKWRFGFWRARVYQRHPKKMTGDSYTPPSMQLQFVSLALLALFALFPSTRAISVAFAALFFGATIPAVKRALPIGRDVAAAAPFMLLVRTGALTCGLGMGFGAVLWTAMRSKLRIRPASSVQGEHVLDTKGNHFDGIS